MFRQPRLHLLLGRCLFIGGSRAYLLGLLRVDLDLVLGHGELQLHGKLRGRSLRHVVMSPDVSRLFPLGNWLLKGL